MLLTCSLIIWCIPEILLQYLLFGRLLMFWILLPKRKDFSFHKDLLLVLWKSQIGIWGGQSWLLRLVVFNSWARNTLAGLICLSFLLAWAAKSKLFTYYLNYLHQSFLMHVLTPCTICLRYPFTNNQAIPPMDWEQYLSEIASDIMKEQSPKRYSCSPSK